MLLGFDLTTGISQNVLIDVVNENVHILPKELNNLKSVLEEYVDYDLSDCEVIDKPVSTPSWVEFIEVVFNSQLLTNVFRLASDLLTEHILFHVDSAEDYHYLVNEITRKKTAGDFMLYQIIIAITFDINQCDELIDNNGFISVVSLSELKKKRRIHPDNFIIDKDAILGSEQRNLFYYSRIYIDYDGFVKPHSGSSMREICIKEELNISAVKSSEKLKELWNIPANKIESCGQCEFRKICFDIRVPVLDLDGVYRKSGNCPYDPHTGEWSIEV